MEQQKPTSSNIDTVNEIYFNTKDLISDISVKICELANEIKDLIDSGFQKKFYNHRNFGSGMDAYRLRNEALFEHFEDKFNELYSEVFQNDKKTQSEQETWFKICWHILSYSQMRHMQNWTEESCLEPKSITMRTALFNMEIVGNLMEHSCDYESMPKDYIIRCLTGMQ
jgi:hypothetical protein